MCIFTVKRTHLVRYRGPGCSFSDAERPSGPAESDLLFRFSIEGLRRGRRGGGVGGARRGEGRGVCHRAGWNSGAVGKDQGAGRRRALSPSVGRSVGPSTSVRARHSRRWRWACDRARAAAGPLRWGRVPAGLVGPTGLLGLCGSVRVRPIERSVTELSCASLCPIDSGAYVQA